MSQQIAQRYRIRESLPISLTGEYIRKNPDNPCDVTAASHVLAMSHVTEVYYVIAIAKAIAKDQVR